MRHRVWVLGAPDPEMGLIERMLRDADESVIYATTDDGRRVSASEAYRCPIPGAPEGSTVYAVECIDRLPEGWIRIDHHRPGDPGYGRPPSDFLFASSIGQVLLILRRHIAYYYDTRENEWVTSDGGEPRDVGGHLIGMPYSADVRREIVYAAAADHCLAAAYHGECPGVDPDALMKWRVKSRARFQGRSADEILADVERARGALRAAPTVQLANGIDARDMRDAYTVRTTLVAPFTDGANVDSAGVGDSMTITFGPRAEGTWDEGGHHTVVQHGVPELPEAAAREGVCFVARLSGGPDGRTKIVCQSGSPEQIRAFMTAWAPAQGLSDIYGDPARGFAGGYLAT